MPEEKWRRERLLLVVVCTAGALNAVSGGERVGAVRDEQIVIRRGAADC